MIQSRLQILMVSLATLFGRARDDETRDANPVMGTLRMYELNEISVLGLRPRAPPVNGHVEEMDGI